MRQPHRHDASSSWGMGSSAKGKDFKSNSECIAENLFRFAESRLCQSEREWISFDGRLIDHISATFTFRPLSEISSSAYFIQSTISQFSCVYKILSQ